MDSNFTIQDLQDDMLVDNVLANVALTFHKLDLAYDQYVATQLLDGKPILSREKWIGAISSNGF